MYRVLGFVLLVGLAAAKHEDYDGHTLFQVTVKTVEQTQFVNDLTNELDLDLWSHALPGRPGLILVPREQRVAFQNGLFAAEIEYRVESENIKELLDLEDRLLSEASSRSNNGSKMDSLPFDKIYTYHQVDTFLELLAQNYPATVKLVNAGRSIEGRDIKYLKISTTNFEDASKPIVYMESLLHAREWITLPATLYAIHKLVLDVAEQDLLRDIDWIILPIANPDGYVHTHQDSRFWRKNRNTAAGLICSGVDLNRNFDIFWGEASSSNACMETFHGSRPFSEPETSIIRDIVLEHRDRMELFLDIHSFGSMILYGYGTGVLPPNGLFVHLVGVNMAQAIDAVKMSYNPNYIVGNVAMVLYEASGSAKDYAMSMGVPFSYTYELPGYRWDIGTALGFLVDPAFIEQAGFETWEGIKVAARYVRDNYRRKHGAM